jgi:hypothetical protein
VNLHLTQLQYVRPNRHQRAGPDPIGTMANNRTGTRFRPNSIVSAHPYTGPDHTELADMPIKCCIPDLRPVEPPR